MLARLFPTVSLFTLYSRASLGNSEVYKGLPTSPDNRDNPSQTCLQVQPVLDNPSIEALFPGSKLC